MQGSPKRRFEIKAAESSKVRSPNPVKTYVPPIPFPQRLQKNKLDKQFEKFLEVFKKLYMNIPFTDALAQMLLSIKYPRGVVEDVLIKVDKFFFPVDFIVLDIEEDRNMPVILGRPFLATSRALIDVEKGELILRVQDERAIFSMYTTLEQPIDLEECFRVDERVKLGQENCKPDTGGLVAPIKDENGRFKIWRAKEKVCKAGNCK
ncbi:reverse transcriptase [Abeliophyllum distichum]|uniref:Reverse transcriptase n=1 Tax=Abeliophyllum distichum TaxID=126358 RepID=A0ABD1RWK9_9LAMI